MRRNKTTVQASSSRSTLADIDEEQVITVTQILTSKIDAPVEVVDNLLKSFKYDVLHSEDIKHSNFQYLVKASNVVLTHQLIKYIDNINSQDGNGDTLLHIAARNKNDLICCTLVSQDNINMCIVNHDGKNVLHEAAQSGSIDSVKTILIQKKLNVNDQDFLKFTPLHYALLNRHDDVAMLLIACGADLLIENYRKETGYHIAFAKNCTKVINKIESEKLLGKIKFSNYVTIYYNTILFYINSTTLLDKIWNPEIETFKNLLNYRRQTVVYYACARKNAALLRYFIEKRNCNWEENVGEHLMHKAIKYRSEEMVSILSQFYAGSEDNKFFLDCVEAAEIYGSDKIAAMMDSYSRDHKNYGHENDLIHYVALGSSVYAQVERHGYHKLFKENKYGMSPYLYLVLYNKYNVLHHIIDLNEKKHLNENLYRVNSKTGNTVIHYAIECGNHKLFNLIANSLPAHVNFPNNNNQTPLNLASIKNETCFVKTLLDTFIKMNFALASDDSSLVDCLKHNVKPDVNLLSTLINAGCNVNFAVKNLSPLLIAIANQNEEIVLFLLSRNANIHFMTASRFKEENRYEVAMEENNIPYSNTLLHIAASNWNSKITEYLLRYGAITMINRYNSLGVTPFHYAIIHNRVEQVSLLLKHGADYNKLVIESKDTPLHLAAHTGNRQIVMLLLKYRPKLRLNSYKCYPSAVAASKLFLDICNLLLHYESEHFSKLNQ